VGTIGGAGLGTETAGAGVGIIGGAGLGTETAGAGVGGLEADGRRMVDAMVDDRVLKN
jgi:hypothetical protein